MTVKVQHLADHVDARLQFATGEGDQASAKSTGRTGSLDIQNVYSQVSLNHFSEITQCGIQLGHHLFGSAFLRTKYLRSSGRPTQWVCHISGADNLHTGDAGQ